MVLYIHIDLICGCGWLRIENPMAKRCDDADFLQWVIFARKTGTLEPHGAFPILKALLP